ncbi:MAG TPA: glycosyltransferase family 2 protein [Candidatus Deferrimicrobium sp.]|nr:glycosyltransferase family 2 protein [Candidatus Deferrimicrobium sp.]
MKLTISIVTFNNEDVIRDALNSIEKSTLKQTANCAVVVVDNSSTDKTAAIVSREFPKVTLIRAENMGFSAGHNKAIRYVLENTGLEPEYHLIMNPDVFFDEDVLEKLVAFMDAEKDAGLVMPKILYPDHQVQYLCKLLPTPFDLFGRRFMPCFLKVLFKRRFEAYEFRNRDYNESMEVPHLSGCFMMMRTGIFEKVGLLDERFFIYLEDVDISRRIHAQFKTVYYPGVYVFHHYRKGSYKRLKHLKYHICSAIKYFNKWGWFNDKERKEINNKCLRRPGTFSRKGSWTSQSF